MSAKPEDPPGRPTVFLSYSHKDEVWKDRLTAHLKGLSLQNVLEPWDDRRIRGGDDWLAEIEAAMNRAAVAVLLISPDFLASEFIQDKEVPHLLKRRQEEGLRVIPLFVRPCAWTAVDWLAALQGRPKDAKPLSTCRKHQADKHLADFVLEIRAWLGEPLTPCPPLPSHTHPPGRGGTPAGDRGPDPPPTPAYVPPLPVEGRGWERGPGGEGLPRLDLGRLPTAGPYLIGRETELARLDAAWEDPNTRILTLVAFGGTGKSALVGRWLQNLSLDGYRGARRVLDWSFYSQGSEQDRVASADRFLDHALTWFGDPNPKEGSSRDRGLRLADLIRQEKTLLVLDGVEPLQNPPNHPLAGRLRDPGLAALLKALAAGSQGLCVITTRERIDDLEGLPTAPQEDLESLSPESGAELLKTLGVKGKDEELLDASKRFGNHALTLSLLGGYLVRACGGDVRRCNEVDIAGAAEKKGGHALRVIGTYASWLGEGPELAALRLLGLFDRPAQPKAIAALRAKPAIPGLTDKLMTRTRWWSRPESISEETWQLALSNLREHGFLLPPDPRQPGTLDAHPLVRVYFQEDLQTNRSEAWKAGNLRLYEHLLKEAPDLPDTLEAMAPLYTAVIHGCRAGRQQEALVEVYRRRIRRGQEAYSIKKLAAFGSDLSALFGFFDRPWDQPSARVTSEDQAWVLNAAGFCLRALGRLAEAVAPMEAGLKIRLQQEKWENAAIIASNLSELTLTLGEVARAVSFGKQSVDLADRSGDAFQRMGKRTTLADALHQSGRLEESAEAFREAEALQAELQHGYPRLYSIQGYRYCDLLLSRGEPEAWEDAQERAEYALKIVLSGSRNLLDIALNHLSLGRAHLGLGDFAKAVESLDQAVEGLRQSGHEEFVTRGLLARAVLRRLRKDWPGAEADLFEAMEIAERGLMRLHECDAHLEWARLCEDRGDREDAERHMAKARKLVEETGYGRRRGEVGLA